MLKKTCTECGGTINVLEEFAWGVTKCRDCLLDEEADITREIGKLGGV